MKEVINIHNYEAFLLDYAEGNLDEFAIAQLKAFITANPQLEIELDTTELPKLSSDSIVSDFKNELFKNENTLTDEKLIAYLENDLSQQERAELENELSVNKQLQQDLNLYRKTILSSNPEIQFDKSGLIKSEDDLILNNKTLAYFENQLPVNEKISFENELKKNKALKAELNLFTKTILIADTTSVYPDKKSLKKEGKLILLFGYRNMASVAAALLLLFGLFTLTRYFYNQQAVEVKPVLSHKKNRVDTVLRKTNSINTTHPLHAAKARLAQTPAPKSKNESRPNTKNNSTLSQTELSEKKLAQTTTNTIAPLSHSVIESQVTVNTPSPAVQLFETRKDTVNQDLALKPINKAAPDFQSLNQLALANDDDEEERNDDTKKTGFWQRVAKVAKRANAIGIKSIDGEENENNSVLISFNALSIEKK